VDRGGAHGLGGMAGGRWEVAIDGEPSADKEAAGDGAPPSNAVDGSSSRTMSRYSWVTSTATAGSDGGGQCCLSAHVRWVTGARGNNSRGQLMRGPGAFKLFLRFLNPPNFEFQNDGLANLQNSSNFAS
jgi:hypothetical protein